MSVQDEADKTAYEILSKYHVIAVVGCSRNEGNIIIADISELMKRENTRRDLISKLKEYTSKINGDIRDGTRILIDKLWPRGVRRSTSNIDLWLKEVGPSDDLRKWFAHEKDKRPAFHNEQVHYEGALQAFLKAHFAFLICSMRLLSILKSTTPLLCSLSLAA